MRDSVEGSAEAISDVGGSRVAGAAILVARRRRPWRDALKSVLAACAGTVNIVAVMYLSSGVESYECGRRNADPPFLFGRSETVALLLWAISGLALVVMALTGPLPRRWFARGVLLVCAVAVPMGCHTRPMPGERYEEGFRDWAAENVPADAVRQWGATLPAVAAATPVGAGQWSAEVARLSPRAVTQLPGGPGVVLQWGVLASWGTAREVVVCGSNDVAPPAEEHYVWRQVREGVYAAFEITN